MIDRSQTRDTPWDPVAAFRHRRPVWNSRRGTHLGRRSVHRHQQAGHMIPSDPIRSLHHLLQAGGRPHMGPGSRARTGTPPDKAHRDARSAGTRARCRRRDGAQAPSRCNRTASFPIHHVKQRSLLRSRGAFLRPGFALSLFHPPREGRAERCDVVTAGATPARAARSQHAANGSAARGEPITGGHAQWVTERPLEPSFSNSSSSVMSRFLYSSGIDSTS